MSRAKTGAMNTTGSRPRKRAAAASAVLTSLLLSACASAQASCIVLPVTPLAPEHGALLGVNLD